MHHDVSSEICCAELGLQGVSIQPAQLLVLRHMQRQGGRSPGYLRTTAGTQHQQRHVTVYCKVSTSLLCLAGNHTIPSIGNITPCVQRSFHRVHSFEL
jgi:hypothetical protein